MKLAPIVLFAYSRPQHTRKVLEALSKNHLAKHSILYIYSDAPRDGASDNEIRQIQEVRKLAKEKQWCGTVKVIEQKQNLGLNASVINAINETIEKYGKVIALENDLITSPGFLTYMNNALDLYEKDENVMHISGYTLPVKDNLPETFFYYGASGWGWGTWQRAWKYFNGNSVDLLNQINAAQRMNEFSLNTLRTIGEDLMMNAEAEKKYRKNPTDYKLPGWAWDVAWSASVFLKNGLCLHPRISLVRNIGFDGSGTHFFSDNRGKAYSKQKITDAIKVEPVKIEECKKAKEAIKNYFYLIKNPSFFTKTQQKISFELNKIHKKIKK